MLRRRVVSDRPVRVRIGPSPTGEPHVGTAYIALFNLAFARKNGGKFVLRIEDTDQERSKPEWEAQIMASLKWLGLDWDEGPDVGGPFGPYRQSERQDIHKAHAMQLLEAGHAYRCFATKEELDALRAEQIAKKETPRYDGRHRELPQDQIDAYLAEGRPFVIRMKMPTEGSTVFHDELRGDVEIDNAQVDDQILLKSDGFPTYHLANVVDDHLMGITHVIRAEEWISSTPKHVVLYDMFGWERPKFVHMPLLRNENGSKISKRKAPVSLMDYKSRGFLPQAVVNYLSRMGWSMPDEREIFSFDDFVENFTFERVSLGGPKFDIDKMSWVNGKYYREVLDEKQFGDHLLDYVFAEARLRKLVPLVRERMDRGEDFIPLTEYFFSGDVTIEPEQIKPKKQTFKALAQVFEKYADLLDRQDDYSPAALEEVTRTFVEAEAWKTRDFFMPLRIAITGRKASPPLFDVMTILGRPLVRRRLRAAVHVAKLGAKQEAKAK